MNRALADRVINALIYEGAMLYPYRRSALKNQQRWNFGILYPSGVEPFLMTTECLIEDAIANVAVSVRFLQLPEDDNDYEPIERAIDAQSPGLYPFTFGGIDGSVSVTCRVTQPGVTRVRVDIVNRTTRDFEKDLLRQCLISTHTLLEAREGAFVSLLDPPPQLKEAAGNCQNVGAWPVLMGEEGERDCMLAAPIILYDYPKVAEESPHDLYDCTEIDEILTLRILTLSDAEKEEIRRSGGRELRLLDRVESLTPQQMLDLHGAIRKPQPFRRGDRVRIRPRPGGDIFDVALAGRIAIVESVERDYESRTHVAVVVEDDPGLDLGLMRLPGHRFFFSASELERIS
jgi:hypothetical protein